MSPPGTTTTTPTASSPAARSAESADAVERFYWALEQDDVAGALSVLHPDVVLHVPGTHPLTGDHHGPQGVLEFVVASRGMSVDGERVELVDLLSGSSHLAALCRITADRPDGRTLENHTIHLMRTAVDGRILEIWFHNRDQVDVDTFWGAP